MSGWTSVGGAQTAGSAGDAVCLPACSAAWAHSQSVRYRSECNHITSVFNT